MSENLNGLSEKFKKLDTWKHIITVRAPCRAKMDAIDKLRFSSSEKCGLKDLYDWLWKVWDLVDRYSSNPAKLVWQPGQSDLVICCYYTYYSAGLFLGIGRAVVERGLRAALSSAITGRCCSGNWLQASQPCHLLLLPAYARATSQRQGCISNKEGTHGRLLPQS